MIQEKKGEKTGEKGMEYRWPGTCSNFGYIPDRAGFRDSVKCVLDPHSVRFHLSFKRIRIQVEPSERAQ